MKMEFYKNKNIFSLCILNTNGKFVKTPRIRYNTTQNGKGNKNQKYKENTWKKTDFGKQNLKRKQKKILQILFRNIPEKNIKITLIHQTLTHTHPTPPNHKIRYIYNFNLYKLKKEMKTREINKK